VAARLCLHLTEPTSRGQLIRLDRGVGNRTSGAGRNGKGAGTGIWHTVLGGLLSLSDGMRRVVLGQNCRAAHAPDYKAKYK